MRLGIIGKGLVAVTAAATLSSIYAETTLEEVTVIARKRAENVQEVPIAVTPFTAQEIQDAGIRRPADFIDLIPNVTIVDTANVGDTQVSIRGIVSTRDSESTFAYVVDGVLITNPNAFNGELIDIEQIEVLKGPQGALYGRNAVAGAILVNTKTPSNDFEVLAKAGVGNNSSYNASALISGPMIEDTLAASQTAYNNRTDGFYTNEFTGADDAVDYLEDTGVRGRMIWQVNDDMTVDFRAGTKRVEGGAINFNAVFAIPLFADFLQSPAFFKDVNTHEFVFGFNVPGENEQKTNEFSIKADWSMNAFDVMAIAYGQVSAADDARQVARIATDALVLRNASPEEAAELAYSRAQARGIEVSPEAITVEGDGSVTVVIDRDIQTLVAYRIGPIEDYSRVTETYTSPATN